MVCDRWTDRQTDGPTEKVTYRGGWVPHLKRNQSFLLSSKGIITLDST